MLGFLLWLKLWLLTKIRFRPSTVGFQQRLVILTAATHFMSVLLFLLVEVVLMVDMSGIRPLLWTPAGQIGKVISQSNDAEIWNYDLEISQEIAPMAEQENKRQTQWSGTCALNCPVRKQRGDFLYSCILVNFGTDSHYAYMSFNYVNNANVKI